MSGALVSPAYAEQGTRYPSPPLVAADVPHAAYHDEGVAPPGTSVAIAVILNYHRAAELEQLVALQSDSGSPYYRHWLTSSNFANEFAPTPAEYARMIRSLERGGFHITRTFANRTIVDAEGRVAAADRYFGTKIDRVYQPGYGARYANVMPAYTPPDVRDLVYSVSGLQNLSMVHTDLRFANRAEGPALLHRSTSSPRLFGPTSSATGLYGYSPWAFRIGYDAPSTHKSSEDGTGRSAGIVIDADYANGDLAAYLKYFGINRTGPATQRVMIDGGPSTKFVDSDATEATLDTETLVGVSPGIQLYLYEMPQFAVAANPEKNITDAYNQVVSDNKVDSVNSSFGICESADPSSTKAWDHIATQGVALGMTFHASTGDEGAYGCNAGGGVEAPASSPHFLAVGATTLLLQSTGAYQGELGWLGSGGGFSMEFPTPTFQRRVKNATMLGRNLPDVAFDGNPDTGIALYYGGTWNTTFNPIGGTSLASPLFGALLDQIEQVNGGRLGLVATKLYALSSAGYTRGALPEFHDVIEGTNGMYVARIGYDNVTGIGSFDAWNLAQLLGKK
jgi:kumamolisin